jgi:hypothetical protein
LPCYYKPELNDLAWRRQLRNIQLLLCRQVLLLLLLQGSLRP